jgi:hypothetical protein
VNDIGALKEEGEGMFIPVMESMAKFTGATAEMQQEMFKKWFSAWPGFPFVPGVPNYPAAFGEKAQYYQKKSSEIITDLFKKQRETFEAQFKAGQENIEKAFKISEAKNPEELRAKTLELWQKCFEAVYKASEAQMRNFTTAIEKWFELVTPFPPS